MISSPKNETRIFLLLFVVLAIASVYTIFSSNSTAAILLYVVPIVLLLMQVFKKLKANIFFLVWACWSLINLLHMCNLVNSYFLRVVIFQNIVIVLLYLSSLYCCSAMQFETTRKVIDVFTTILCIIEVIFSITGRTEGFSFILFGLMYFFLCDNGKSKYIKLILMMIAFWVGRSRSSILMLAVCLVCGYILKAIRKSKVLYKLAFFIVAAITYLIPYGYVWLYKSPYRNYLNSISRSIFGKNFFSGRNILWVQIYSWLEQNNMLWGIGGEFVGGSYAEQLGMSTHNVSLFLLGQGGIVLLLLFYITLYKIYMHFFPYTDDPVVIAGSSFLLGLMIRSSFDLILIANQFIPSMYAWLSICIVLSYCNYQKNDLKRNATIQKTHT